MKIYTRTGDDGETGLFGGGRVPKDHPRVEACGSIDELSALLGVVRAGGLEDPVDRLLAEIQSDLFDIGAALATPAVPARLQERFPRLGEARVTALEEEIDAFTAQLPPLHRFILPGGSAAGAHIHFARAVCRRAERRLVQLAHREEIAPLLIRYLNRLSDLLFTLGRYVNARAGKTEIPWQGLDREERGS